MIIVEVKNEIPKHVPRRHCHGGGTIRPDDVVTFEPSINEVCINAIRADRDKIANRLSKCRDEKRGLASELDAVRQELAA